MMVATRTIRWRPNWWGWGTLAVLVLAFGVGLPALHNYQSQRIVERIRARAEAAEKRLAAAKAAGHEEEVGKALTDLVKNYDLYLRHRPGETAAQIALALAVAEQADRARGNAQLQWHAYRVLSRALAKVPDEPRLLEALASLAMRLQQWEEAASLWRELWQNDPQRVLAGLNLAKCQIAREKIREAIDTLRGVIERDPALLEAYVLLAKCYRAPAVQDYESARVTIDDMVSRNHGSADAHAQRAAFWWWVSQTTSNPAEAAQAMDAAKKDVATALEAVPEHLEALLISANIALHEGDLDKTKEILSLAEETAPEDRRVWAAHVNWARLAGDIDREETYLKRLTLEDPSRLPELAELHLSRQPPDLAAARNIIALMQRARFPAQYLQFWQARLTFLQGDRVKGLSRLEGLYRSIGREDDALREWVGLALAEAYLQMGMRDSAGAVLSQLRERAPDSPRVQAAWANWLIQSGQSELALYEFERILQSQYAARVRNSGEFLRNLFLARLAAARGRPLDSPEWQQLDQLLQQVVQSSVIADDDKVLMRSRYLEARGQTDEATKLLHEAIQSDASPRLRLELASLLARQNRTDEALATLEAALQGAGFRSDILRMMIELAELVDENKRNETLRQVMQELEKLPAADQRPVVRAVARFHLRIGNTAEAEALWEKLARGDESDVEPPRVLLEMACQKGDFEKAKAWLEELRRIEGQSGRVTLLSAALLKVYQSMQKAVSPSDRSRLLMEAKEDLAVLEKQFPYWPDVLRLKARIALLEGRLAAAIDQYRLLERRGLLMREGKEELARLLLLRGQNEEARKVLTTSPLRVSDLQSVKLQAELLAREGRIPEAIKLVEPLLAKSSDPLDWLWYAQFLSRAKQTENADKAFAHAIALAPNWPEAHLAQIMHLVATDRKTEAENLIQAWQKRQIQDVSERRVLALGLELLGRPDQAEEIYRKTIQENPESGDLLLEWAGFCLRQGRTSECRAVLERLVSAKADGLRVSDSTKLDARRNLAQLLGLSPDYRDVCRAIELLTANLNEQGLLVDRCLLGRVLSQRPERSSRERAVAEYQTVIREGGILSPEDRFAFARALASLGSWPDARMQMLELFRPGAPIQPSHLVFFINQLIRFRSPAEEIQPHLNTLRSVPGYDFVALELQTKLAVRDGRADEVHGPWDERLERAIGEKRWADAEAVLTAAESSGLTAWTEKAWTRLSEVRKESVLGKALFLGRQKRLKEALELCEKTSETLPITAVASVAMSVLRLNRSGIQDRDLAMVEGWLLKARESNPNDKRIAIDLASFLNLAGRYEECEKAYRELLARKDLSDMEKALIKNNLAYILAAKGRSVSGAASEGRLQEAESLIEQAIAVIGPIGSLLDTRTVVRLGLGKNREALSDAQQAVVEEPTPLSYFHLVEALIAVGDTPTALREWQRACKDFGLTPEALPPVERERFRIVAQRLEG